MADQQRWFAGNVADTNDGLALAAATEAYAGHLDKARDLTKRAVDSAMRDGQQRKCSYVPGDCGAAASGVRKSRGSPTISGRGFAACPHQ